LGGVVLRGEIFELVDDSGKGRFDVGDRAFGVIGPLLLQTAMMLDEFFPIKLDDVVCRAKTGVKV
jgi:hypothetical protein